MSPPRIVIKNLRNRWGSITSKGILNLNLNLLKAPNQVIDYIIIHELCHLIINNHSHHFWRQIRKIIPDYDKSIIWLEDNAALLISTT
jgi:predicted metal-dependent hydrolase